jgi:hypothetical protein
LFDRGGAERAGQQLGVDAMSAAGHHEQRFAVALEHETVSDRTDLAAERGRHAGIPVVHVS